MERYLPWCSPKGSCSSCNESYLLLCIPKRVEVKVLRNSGRRYDKLWSAKFYYQKNIFVRAEKEYTLPLLLHHKRIILTSSVVLLLYRRAQEKKEKGMKKRCRKPMSKNLVRPPEFWRCKSIYGKEEIF